MKAISTFEEQDAIAEPATGTTSATVAGAEVRARCLSPSPVFSSDIDY